MKNKKFAKIFDLKNGQVLVTKQNSELDETFDVVQMTEFNGNVISLELNFVIEQNRDKCFDAYSIKDARLFLKNSKPIDYNDPDKRVKKINKNS